MSTFADPAPDRPVALGAAPVLHDISAGVAKDSAYGALGQQMQSFMALADMQQNKRNKYYLQDIFELLGQLKQENERESQLRAALQESESKVAAIKQQLVAIASESAAAEKESLAIAEARTHLAALLHEKIVKEFQ
jgi:septal ring factor EnvC (AmiA/AmiB activator)